MNSENLAYAIGCLSAELEEKAFKLIKYLPPSKLSDHKLVRVLYLALIHRYVTSELRKGAVGKEILEDFMDAILDAQKHIN